MWGTSPSFAMTTNACIGAIPPLLSTSKSKPHRTTSPTSYRTKSIAWYRNAEPSRIVNEANCLNGCGQLGSNVGEYVYGGHTIFQH